MPFKKQHTKCGLSELDYSSRKLIQNDVAYDYTSELTPRNTIIPDNPIVFQIEGSNDFVDLSNTFLKMTLSIADADGVGIGNDDKIAPINNFANSLFSQISVSLKNTTVSHPSPNYAYRAYLDNLLNFSPESKATWLTYEGFYKDQAGAFDAETNTGLINRKALFKNKRKHEVVTRLHCDVCFQENLLPSNLDIRFVLTPARQEFVIQNFTATKVFNIKIEQAKLIVRRVKLTPERNLAFENQIARDEIRLPLSYVRLNTYTLATGIKSFDKNGLFSGTLPDVAILGLVENDSYTGTFGSNPYNFKSFNLTQMQFVINGRALPTSPISMDFENQNIYDGFNSLRASLGKQHQDTSNGLNLSDYIGGSALYGVNFNSNTNCPHDDGIMNGQIDISIKFSTGLPKPITLIVYSQTETAILIDKFRNAILESF